MGLKFFVGVYRSTHVIFFLWALVIVSFRKFVHFICVEILWNIFLLSLSCPEVYRDISTFIPQIGNLCFLFLSWWVWLYVYQFHWSLQKPVFGYIILFLFTAHYRFHLFLLLSLFFLYFDYLGLICLFFPAFSRWKLRYWFENLPTSSHWASPCRCKSFADYMRR